MITTLNQVKAQSLAQKRNFVISSRDANTPVTPIKKSIVIKYDSYGVPSSAAIDLGLYGDRNVTILTFDFSDLVWTNAKATDYQFNLFIDDQEIIDPTTQFVVSDNFLVDYAIDTISLGLGAHRFAVSILEKDVAGHNIDVDQEIFICRSFVGTINASDYRPSILAPFEYDAISGKGLRRNAIEVLLADDGQFALKGAMTDEHFSTDLGVQYDNFVSYVCFNSKDDITAKIESLTYQYIVFQQGENSYWVKLVESTGHKHGEDNTLMAWVPPVVLQTVSNWTIYLVARNSQDNFTIQFVSHSINLAVISSPIAQEEIDKVNGAKVAITFNFSFLDSDNMPMHYASASIKDSAFTIIGQIKHGISKTLYLYKNAEYGIELNPNTLEWSNGEGTTIIGGIDSITIDPTQTTIGREYHANTIGAQASPEDIKQNYYAFTLEGERIDGAMEEANPSADVQYKDN